MYRAVPANIQLLSIPQLDVIQRTLKILDVRLQHVQSNCKSEEKTKQDINHIRRVMLKNHRCKEQKRRDINHIRSHV